VPPQGCGEVEEHGIALDCGEIGQPGEYDGVDVVSRDAIETDRTRVGGLVLPPQVDHRDEGTEGPVRNQGKVSDCTSFALAAAIDHALMRREHKPLAVSTMHLWSRYHHRFHPMDSNNGVPITSESQWPYDLVVACQWQTHKDCKGCEIGWKRHECDVPVDKALLAAADAKPLARIVHYVRIDTPSVVELKRILARGQDLYFGTKLNRPAFKDAKAPDYVIGDYDPTTQQAGGHAMVLAGYRDQAGGTYFLMHNSWGERFGDKGYAWFHESTMSKLKGAYVVEAVPFGTTVPGVNSPQKPGPACAAGQAPDAANGTCAAVCPDSSPRFNGACPAVDCDPGEVGINGQCVTAAPVRKGSQPATQVEFDCHSGGCVYVIPQGTLECAHPKCAISCPAPAYILAKNKAGVFCTE
jgi:hypothetical protein